MNDRYLVKLPCGCIVFGVDAVLDVRNNAIPETEREPVIINVNCKKHNGAD